MVAVTVAMAWPLPARVATHLPSRGTNYDMVFCAWILARVSQNLLAFDLGRFFDGGVFYPVSSTLTLSDHLLGFQPVVLPVYAVTGNILLAYNLAFLLTFVLTGYFTYLLVRHLTRHEAAAVVAGLALAFCHFRFQHWHHISLSGFEWMPLTLWCLHRLVERPGVAWGLAAGAAVAMQALTGMYQGAYLALAAGLFLLCFLPATGAWRKGRLWAGLAVAGLVVLVTNGPALRVYLRAHHGLGLERSMETLERGSAAMTDYLKVHLTNQVLPTLGVPVPDERQQFVAWPGAMVVVHAVIGVAAAFTRRRRRTLGPVLFYLLLAGVFWVLSLGPTIHTTRDRAIGWGPYRLLVDLVPGFATMRYPIRTSVVVSVALAVLAGYGVAAVAGRLRQRRAAVYAAAAGALILVESASVPTETTRMTLDRDQRGLVEWLAGREGPCVVAHFPAIATAALETQPEYFMYLSTFGAHPIVNGESAFFPPAYRFINAKLARFPRPDAVDLLQALGVTHAVVHPAPEAAWGSDPASVVEPRLAPVAGFGPIAVFAVAPGNADWRAALAQPDALLMPDVLPAGQSVQMAFDLHTRSRLPIIGMPFERARVEWLESGAVVAGERVPPPVYDQITRLSGDYLWVPLAVPPRTSVDAFRLVGTDGEVLVERPVRVVDPGEDYWSGADDPAPRAEMANLGLLRGAPAPGRGTWFWIRLTNRGARTWRARSAETALGPAPSVRLGWQLRGEGGDVLKTGRRFLPCDLGPGQTVTLSIRVTLPAATGTWRLMVDPITKGVGWFGERGSAPLALDVPAAPASPPGGSPADQGPLRGD